MKNHLIGFILCGLSAFGATYATLCHFDNTHGVIIIPQSDGKFLANDLDSERAKKQWNKKRVAEAKKYTLIK